MNYIHGFLISLAGFLITNSAFSQSQYDFDRDGKSDFTLISVKNDKTLNWSSIYSSTNAENSMGDLGSNGDHIILGSWKGEGTPQIGVVTVNGKNLLWRIQNNGVIEEREFGRKNQTAMAGADFDGDKVADAAVAMLKKKSVQWEISFGLFNSIIGQAKTSKLTFGQSGDRIFYANADGVSDWVGTIGKGLNGKGALLRLKSLRTGEVKSSTKFPKYIVSKRIRPIPLSNGSNDYLIFPLVSGGNAKVDIRTIEGAQVAEAVLPGKGDIVVGNFTEDAGEEVAIKTSSGFSIFSPVSKQTLSVATVNGIAVDEVNINTISGSSGGSGGSGGNSGGTPPSGGNSACSSVVSWPSSHIYKTVGSHHFTDIRRNTSGIILKRGARGPYPTCISIVDTKGNVVASMGRYAIGESLWSARYYAGIGCGSSTPLSGSSMASRARSNTGSPFVYANFGSACYGPIDAARCIGSAQR